jgi:diguanylate cyclase (GGDEF)-like protein
VRRALAFLPASALGRVRLIAVLLACASLSGLVYTPDYSSFAHVLLLLPQALLVGALIWMIYNAVSRQERAAARDALLARSGAAMMAAADPEAVFAIATDASIELIENSQGAVVIIAMRDDDGALRIKSAPGLRDDVRDRTLPDAVLERPLAELAALAPGIHGWEIDELIPGRRYRFLGAARGADLSVLDAFRTLSNQVVLAEANLRSHAELDHQANHDALTQLPTRAKFFRELIAAVDAGTPGSVALLNIDLDDFKQINDVYGHQSGDELLVEVAQRVQAAGGEHGLPGRLGGDEFVLLLTGLTDPTEAARTAELLCERLVEPMRLTKATVRVGASIGVALSEEGVRASELSRRADIAMYAAKARGKNRVEVFTAGEHGDVARHRLLEDQLPYALERGEIKVFYQPYVDLHTLDWSGVEALVYWEHPTMGGVSCRELLALAERTGDIAAVTAFFLRTVAREIGAMPGGDHLRIGINLSGRQLYDPRYADAVRDVLDECRIEPSRLYLEIVESEQMDDPRARARLEELASHGVRIALDDFGTGHVSLASLSGFPIHQLKVDATFLTGDPAALDLVLSVADLLGTETLVQGVADSSLFERLRATSAACAQGDHLAPIVTGAGLAELLSAGHGVAS